MKICVLSDLHCKYQTDINEQSETFLFSNMPRKPVNQNPVTSLLRLIDSDPYITSDVVLCVGDLGDKADEQGIISAWASVEEITQKIGASLKVGVPGNHDVNSRRNHGKGAFEFIENFHEDFPTSDEALNIKFWNKKFCIKIYNQSLILLINTIHNHTDEEGAKSSLIEKTTLEDISDEFSKLDMPKYSNKICLLHHHPIKHSNINNWKDSDSLDKGDELIKLLNVNTFDIVLHGHKHQPRVTENSGLTIFAAGSFSSFANLQGTGFGTMFHIIDLDDNSKKGTISTWEFNVKNGWQKNYNLHFPPKIGFGCNFDPISVASAIDKIFKRSNSPIFYTEILAEIPDLEFLIPEKLESLGYILNTQYNLYMQPEYPLTPNILTANPNKNA